jgi:hypothetical protein
VRRRPLVKRIFVVPDRDYTPTEWAAIDSAVAEAKRMHARIKKRRPSGLLPEDRSALRAFRDNFQIMMTVAQTPTSQVTVRKIIRRIAWLCGELSRTIAQINGRASSQILNDPCRIMSLLEEWMVLKDRRALRIDRILREFGSARVQPGRGLRSKFWCTPKGFLYFEIISLWVKIGGELKFQRDKATKSLGGPLLDFMEAVANPLLCNVALKRESLRDVIELARINLRLPTAASAGHWEISRSAA